MSICALRRAGGVLLATAFLLAASAAPGAFINNLPLLSGDTHGSATDINVAGVIVGVSYTLNQVNVPVFHAARWPTTTTVQAIPRLAGTENAAHALNDSGVSVGWSHNGLPSMSGGFYNVPPSTSLASPGPGTAYGINDNGLIVGANVGQLNGHAYSYASPGSPVDLGSLGGTFSQANDVNNAGIIVGWSNINATSTRRAFRYTTATGMQTIAGLSGFANSEALGINVNGEIVGVGSSSPGTSGQAWRLSNSVMTFLASPSGPSYATDINDNGFIVGSMNGRAALWRPNNTVVDLDAWLDSVALSEGVPWVLTNANALNNAGLVVGYGNFGGVQRAYVLNVASLVPEPSFGLALLAALPLLARRRR